MRCRGQHQVDKSAAIERVHANVRMHTVRTHEVPASRSESAGFISRGAPQGTFEGSQIVQQSSSQLLADEFLQQLASSDVFSPVRATIHTLDERIRTTFVRQHSGEIRIPFTYDALFDARVKLDDIRHERDCVSAQRNLFGRRRGWFFFEDAGSEAAVNRRWTRILLPNKCCGTARV